MAFVHLHLHTEGSKLDGFNTVEELIKRSKELDMPGFAITDHGTMSELWKAQQLETDDCKIIKGCEFYVDYPWDDSKYGHLILLAKDNEGLKNMFALQSMARHNFGRKPRIKREWLKEHHEGIVCMSACLGGEISQAILVNQDVEASIAFYKGLFGEDYYLEVHSNTIPEQTYVNRKLADLGRKHDIRLVASCDSHYLTEDDIQYHELLLAIGTNQKWDNPKRWKFPSEDYWFKSEEEMFYGLTHAGLTESETREAIEQTVLIFDKCNAQIETGHYLQEYPFKPDGYTDGEWLRKETLSGATKRDYHNLDALNYELGVIEDEGYSGYFLTVADYIERARNGGVLVGPGRGSGGGSRVAYCNDITRANPDDYNLLFERFMAHGREPDIDTDFSDIDAVFLLLADAYGWDNVSRIIAKARFTAKNATRRVLGVFKCTSREQNAFSKAMPDRLSFTLEEALNENPQLIKMFKDIQMKLEKQFGEIPDILTMVRKLEGRISHYSKHAGGVLIYPGINKMLPMSSDADERRKMVAEFDMDELHDIGQSGRLEQECSRLNYVNRNSKRVWEYLFLLTGKPKGNPVPSLTNMSYYDNLYYIKEIII